jgi:type IV pilus assembly protein PilV
VGASATQVLAQRSRHGAALAAEAARIASSMAGRMRANPVAMAAADSANPYLFEHDAATEAGPSWLAPCLGSTNCTPLQMAQFDIDETLEALHTRFPRGRIVVCRDMAAWDAAAGALAWNCASAPGAPVIIKLGWRDNGGDAAVPKLAVVVPGAG